MKYEIFVSYSSFDKQFVDELDQDFKSIGITVIRDIRDVKYTQSFKEFMKKIRNSDFVLMIISENYLKSRNCMFEVLEVLKDENYRERILPIVLASANIQNKSTVAKYIQFWEDAYNKLNNEIESLSKDEISFASEELKIIRNIRISMGDFLTTISDMRHVGLEKLKSNNYKELLERIGLKKYDVSQMIEIFEISKITDNEEKEIAIEEFIQANQNNPFAYFLKATLEESNRRYKKAKYYYKKTIKTEANFSEAYNNLAILLVKHFGQMKKALKLLKKAKKIHPNNVEAQKNFEFIKDHKFQLTKPFRYPVVHFIPSSISDDEKELLKSMLTEESKEKKT